ncbi:M28 family peptidase [Formosa sp. S-31]|uniref:M28 family peptidase n=1 Tax=Formosa sp. S-31 TaxID=2790949 RepID=UPI003EC0EBC9
MKKKLQLSLLMGLLMVSVSFSQSVTDLINTVSLDSLMFTTRIFSGEHPVSVAGNQVTILNRVFSKNDLAADYLVETLKKRPNLTVETQLIDDVAGRRNIIATQFGKTNPEKIYLICAHYDAVTNYCADDNASGVAAVLEVARVLSSQCTDNTIVYAFWDEEEIGLVGSKYYAKQAKVANTDILGVYNLDMIAYDGDKDQSFDIDVRQADEGSQGMRNDIMTVLNSYSFKLNANTVIPGTELSDHSSFWNQGYPAVLVGEAWSEEDEHPEYHSERDRVSLFNQQYFHEITKLSLAYIATKAGLQSVSNAVTLTGNSLTAIQEEATYQWYNCETNTVVDGAQSRIFLPTVNGSYKVEITSGSCVEYSDCYEITSLGVTQFDENELYLYPNPIQETLTLECTVCKNASFILYDCSGKVVLTGVAEEKKTELPLSNLQSGMYFLQLKSKSKSGVFKVVKE